MAEEGQNKEGQVNQPFPIEVQRKGGEDILYIDFKNAPFSPSLSDNPDVMAVRIACDAAVISMHSLLGTPENFGPRTRWDR